MNLVKESKRRGCEWGDDMHYSWEVSMCLVQLGVEHEAEVRRQRPERRQGWGEECCNLHRSLHSPNIMLLALLGKVYG